MDLRPVGVNDILAVLGDSISEQTGAQVAALREAIADAHISSVEETIPAYASLLVKYDPRCATVCARWKSGFPLPRFRRAKSSKSPSVTAEYTARICLLSPNTRG